MSDRVYSSPLIKEYWDGSHPPVSSKPRPVCVVRTSSYDTRLSYLEWLFDAAKKDFPDLTKEGCKIVHYAGQRYKGTMGIEFRATSEVPSEYKPISGLEMQL